MQILLQNAGEQLVINGTIVVEVVEVRDGRVSLRVHAPAGTNRPGTSDGVVARTLLACCSRTAT